MPFKRKKEARKCIDQTNFQMKINCPKKKLSMKILSPSRSRKLRFYNWNPHRWRNTASQSISSWCGGRIDTRGREKGGGGNHLSVHMREKSGEAVQKRRGRESPRSSRTGRRGATSELLSEGGRGTSRGVFFEVGSLATTDYCRHDSKDPSSDAVGSDLNPYLFLRFSPSSCTAPKILISRKTRLKKKQRCDR